jgi:nitrile hydratase subunit beta
VDGVHDLGGLQDFGPVALEQDESVFHARWEERVFGLVAIVGAQGLYSVNAFRHAIERMDPVHYLRSPYYEHWLTGAATLLVERGVIDSEELQERAGMAFPLARPLRAPQWRPTASNPAGTARFAVGDRVRVRDFRARGHTRCPRYVRGKHGVVERMEGAFVLPDAEVHAADPPAEQTYCVCFDAVELWGEEAEPRASVSVDLWDSYLEAA